MKRLLKLFKSRRDANARDPAQSQQPDTSVSSVVQSFDPPPIATSPQHDTVGLTVGLGDVQLFESPRSATPRAVAASAPAKIVELSQNTTSTSPRYTARLLPRRKSQLPDQYRERINGRMHKEQIRMEKYNIRYFLYREYELLKIVHMSSTTIINMLKFRLKPPFYPSVLNNSVIDLLKRELESQDYRRLNDLINSDEIKNLRANKGDVEEIDIKPLLLSNFLSKITIIDLDKHVVDKFTLEVLKSIDKSNVFIICLYNINFNNDKTSCKEFLNYLEEYKDCNKLKSLIVSRIVIYGINFEKFIDIIGELKSITMLEFSDFDIIWALDNYEGGVKKSFEDMFMKTLIKLENLKMLIFTYNDIEKHDFENIFTRYRKAIFVKDNNKYLIEFYDSYFNLNKEQNKKFFEFIGYTKSYIKTIKTTRKKGELNNHMSILPLDKNANEIVEPPSPISSFRFTTLYNHDKDKQKLDDFDDILILRNFYKKIEDILEKRRDKDTNAIQKAILKQQEQDAVNKLKTRKTVETKYIKSIATMKQTHLEAIKASQLAYDSTANKQITHSILSDAFQKSRNATRAFEKNLVLKELAKTAVSDEKAAALKLTNENMVATNASSSSSRSSSSISSKIEKLKNSGSSSNSPKKTIQGGKKKLSSDNRACNTKTKSRQRTL